MAQQPKMNQRQVRAAFRRAWIRRCCEVPAYRTDEPARRQFFSIFIDELWMDDRITENMLNNVTING